MLGFMFRTTQAAVRGQAQRRLVAGSLVAVGLAAGLMVAANASPLCVLYTDSDIMWWILGCWDWTPPPW